MLNKINEHQTHIADAYNIPKEQARWLLSTVAFHCFSASDTMYTAARQELATQSTEIESSEMDSAEMDNELIQGFKALIIGSLVMLNDNTYLGAQGNSTEPSA